MSNVQSTPTDALNALKCAADGSSAEETQNVSLVIMPQSVNAEMDFLPMEKLAEKLNVKVI